MWTSTLGFSPENALFSRKQTQNLVGSLIPQAEPGKQHKAHSVKQSHGTRNLEAQTVEIKLLAPRCKAALNMQGLGAFLTKCSPSCGMETCAQFHVQHS